MPRVIHCDADVLIPDGLVGSVHRHTKMPSFSWYPHRVDFVQVDGQKDKGTILLLEVIKQLEEQKKSVLNANVLYELLLDQTVIPDSFGWGCPIFFIGTEFASDKGIVVLYLYRENEGDPWTCGYYPVDKKVNCEAFFAVRASNQT